ncbi:putative selenate ABC transporter substrate-binding protein [Roseateles sp. L2-2]|uniref:putative selenate ABC transporter substrate-binding protein n=1 Tax=Roseateles sp. L2-2 TaxID=3422597 RepID=UPI003D362A66
MRARVAASLFATAIATSIATGIATGLAIVMPEPVRAQTREVLRVTAIPAGSPAELARRFAPLGRYLERELDMKVEWVPTVDYEAVVDGVAHRKIDLALLGGFTFVLANARTGGKIVPLVQRDGDANYRSVFITQPHSGIRRLEQLRGRTFIFGPVSSTSGHLMPRASLLAAKIDPERDLRQVSYSGGHDATAAAVISGKVDAGVLHLYAWERLIEDRKVDAKSVRIFFTTPPFYDTNWSVHAAMPAETRDAIRTAFLKLDASRPEDKDILDLQRATKFVPTRVENYNGIKAAAESAGLLK